MEPPQERNCIQVNMPELFAEVRFIKWLNTNLHEIATWHTKGEPTEYSDIFMTIEMYRRDDIKKGLFAEGSNSNMPQECWERIVKHLFDNGYRGYDGIVWITNMEE